MAELSKSEKYDIFIRSVKGIEGALNGDIYISVDSLLFDIVADIRKVNKSGGINKLGNYKPTEINSGKDNKQSLYRELLENITMKQNSIIKDMSIIYNRDKDITKISYYAGKLSGLNEIFELIHLRYSAEMRKKGGKWN